MSIHELDLAFYFGRSKSLGTMNSTEITCSVNIFPLYIRQNMSADQNDVRKVDATSRSLGVNRHNRYIARYLASMT